MKKQSALLFATLIATTSLSYGASLSSLHKDQVKKAFMDKTVTTIASNHVNDQVVNYAFMGYLDNNGNISGQFVNGASNSNMPQPQSDTGTYKVKNNGLLCITWKTWNNGKEACMNTYETANAYVIVDDHHVFHTAILKSKVQAGNQMGTMNGQMMNTNGTMPSNNNTTPSTTTTPSTQTNGYNQ